jgi:hypothetical protein
LADYLPSKVAALALDVDQFQVPQCDAGFRPLRNNYVEFPNLLIRPQPAHPPQTGGSATIDDTGSRPGLPPLDVSSIVDDLVAAPPPDVDQHRFDEYSAKLAAARQSG